MQEHGLMITAAVTLVAGVGCQALARQIKLPAIVPLLLVGMLLGPSGLGVVDPSLLGDGLRVIVGFAVAIILFEGGLSLRTEMFREGGVAIRNLVVFGAWITWGLSALFAALLFKTSWGTALLFGALVTVTGPTVIIPLLRVARPGKRVAGVLRGEAIVIDPVGALYAVLVLEYLVGTGQSGGWTAALHLGERLLLGVVIGVASAAFLWLLLRRERTLAPDIKNLTVLAVAIATYTISESILEESGVLSVTLGGLILALLHPPGLEEIEKFKGQITLLMVSLVFILLTAAVSLTGLRNLGWRGVALVAALVLVVRPVSVLLSTMRSELTLRERLFISWIAPRGIVAASVSSLFAIMLADRGMRAEGELVRDLTFAVIVGTVMVQAPTARFVGRLLGVLEQDRHGFLIIGANRVGRALGRALQAGGVAVLIVDRNAHMVRWARKGGLNAAVADALDDVEMEQLNTAGIGHMLAVTPNDVVNRLSSEIYRKEFGVGCAHTIRLAESPDAEQTERVQQYVFDETLTLEEMSEQLQRKHRILLVPLDEAPELEEGDRPLGVIKPDGEVVLATGDDALPKKGTLLLFTDRPEKTDDDATEEG